MSVSHVFGSSLLTIIANTHIRTREDKSSPAVGVIFSGKKTCIWDPSQKKDTGITISLHLLLK